ncbi:hypothetical protein N4G70_22170 [Streptomyces sp. ASQP_92]|uniref:hypothetical protein n=1 Tax=unclassified Streptomyces TaxID=2593676 RepID=UPI0021BF618C|nr:hypothetical protein [Streptomyces sp. ASQP_92]MCT9091553.1 hypothetical protein [Streptomyces sp. ASQP_92]
MFDYEMHKTHEAELLRRADRERLVGQARRAARRFGRRSGDNGPEGPVSSPRNRFVRAA